MHISVSLIRAQTKGARAYAAAVSDPCARARIEELCDVVDRLCDYLERKEKTPKIVQK